LRAYLALWVLVDHVLWVAGYWQDTVAGLPTMYATIARLMVSGSYAVDLFIIISGFVIMHLLDKQGEPYLQFIVRRFFRLFPVFIVLFVIAIPLSQVDLEPSQHHARTDRFRPLI
jgi:peptidoglycan/LPS O-acetylase OafA/YrhL